MARAKGPSQSIVAAPIDILDQALDAALTLAADRPWREISLRDIAQEAGVSFADLYARAPGKEVLLTRFSRRLDRATLAAAENASPDVVDRLFEAVMARLEAIEPHRSALIAIVRDEGLLNPAMGVRMTKAARAILEAAGVDAGGRRGAVRILAMTAVWARVLQVWRDDEGALNRTMAEIDKLLKLMRKRLNRIGAGF